MWQCCSVDINEGAFRVTWLLCVSAKTVYTVETHSRAITVYTVSQGIPRKTDGRKLHFERLLELALPH